MNRHAFLGGLHRSGTTLLASLLGSNPRVGGFRHTGAPMDEGQHLQTVCPNDEHHGGVGRFAFHPDAHMTEHSPLAHPATFEALRGQWNRYWDTSRELLVEKSPPNLLRFRFLQAAFPESKFVLVIRHPVPVAMSTQRWAAAVSIRELVEHWIHAYALASADLPYLVSSYVVRYEDLIARPAAVLSDLAAYLEIPAVFETPELDAGANQSYLEQWQARGERMDDLEDAIARHGYSFAGWASDPVLVGGDR